MKKLFFLFLIIGAFVLPGIAEAGVDPRCFAKSDCEEVRRGYIADGLGTGEPAEGFYSGGVAASVCPGQLFSRTDSVFEESGFCSPIARANLSVSIGGRNSFSNIAEYIAYIYRYSMIAAVTLAILVIIVAGLQWIIAAGDSTKIESARKKITGAVVGLVILATSYTILNTINPALVELRLPQVWLLRADEISEPWCGQLDNDVPLALAHDATTDRLFPEPGPDVTSAWTYRGTEDPDDSTVSGATCANTYYIAGSGGQICTGTYCGANSNGRMQLCVNSAGSSVKTCQEGNVGGRIHGGPHIFEDSAGAFAAAVYRSFPISLPNIPTFGFVGEGWGWPWIPDTSDQVLYAVCKNGNTNAASYTFRSNPDIFKDDASHEQTYLIGVSDQEIDELATNCRDEGGLLGFVLGLDIQEAGELDPDNLLIIAGWVAGGPIGAGIGGLATLLFDFSAAEEHYIGKWASEDGESLDKGIDLGDSALRTGVPSARCLLEKVGNNYPQFFITPGELKSGILLNINLDEIMDIDEDNDRRSVYSVLGYDECWAELREARISSTEGPCDRDGDPTEYSECVIEWNSRN